MYGHGISEEVPDKGTLVLFNTWETHVCITKKFISVRTMGQDVILARFYIT